MITHLVVNAFILKEDKVLLERHPGGHWKLMGGHMEEDETPDEALIREIEEELDVKVKFRNYKQTRVGNDIVFLPTPINSFSHTVDSDRGLAKKHRNVGFVYAVEVLTEPTAKDDQEIRWFSKKDLNSDELRPEFRDKLIEILESIGV